MSRIGIKPIAVPKEVKISNNDGLIVVEGPKGKLEYALPFAITAEIKDSKLIFGRKSDSKVNRSLHGLSRALVANMIVGVVSGYTKELEIIGVGFKATVEGKNLVMNLGFCHPVKIPIPEGIKVETPKATIVVVSGINKEKVGKIASEIRAKYPPEPYKGKGVRYRGEYVKKKVGKAQATTK